MTEATGFTVPLWFDFPPRAPDVVPIIDCPGLSAAVFHWQLRPKEDSLVIAIKATFALVPGGVATLCGEAEALSGDEPLTESVVLGPSGSAGVGSLARASDFAPWKPRADVTLTGHAYPSRRVENVAHVAFSFGRIRQAAAVFGDREWDGSRLTAPRPFERMPLVWERAYGGEGFEDNPCGHGVAQVLLPNVEHPEHLIRSPKDRPRPVCFAPIPREWAPRAHKLGTYDAAWLQQRWPYFPDDFDWSYMNAAPLSLQVEYPAGDEHFELAGVHPTIPAITGSLAGQRARAFALGSSASGSTFVELPLVLDTLSFDADTLRVSLVWRGQLGVSDACAPELSRFYVMLEPTSEKTAISNVFARMTAELVARHGPAILTSSLPSPTLIEAPPPVPKAPRPSVDRAAALDFIETHSSLVGADLAGYDLSAVDLSGRDLTNAHLVGAQLEGTCLDGANLTGAILTRAYAASASFQNANLTGVNLAEAVLTLSDFTGATLDYASLVEVHGCRARFENARLRHANFSDAVLDEAVFERATASGAAFSGAWLRRASFVEATLEDAQAYDLHADGAHFDRAQLARLRGDRAQLTRATFVGAHAAESSFDSAVLFEARLEGVDLSGAVLTHADLRGAVLDRATLKGARLRRARLDGAVARKANFMEASLEGADLHQADLRAANLHGADLNQAKLEHAHLDLALLTSTLLAAKEKA